MKFYVKVHKSERSCVVAIADENIICKTFKNNNGTKITVSEFFYKGELYDEEKTKKFLEEYSNVNIVGKNIVKLAEKLNLIKEEDILYFEDVPHCQIYCI